MTSVWALAALWLGLAVIAGLFSMWLRVSTALCEIVVGTLAQLILTAVIGAAVLGTDEGWVKFLAGIGAMPLATWSCEPGGNKKPARGGSRMDSHRFSQR